MNKHENSFKISLYSLCVLYFYLSCNKNLTEEEKAELYSKSTARDAIIERSGTKLRAGTNDAMLDAQME